ncbi:16S rRNA (cytidine(1402)-2'-O)-methyltransferase [Prochlorococcus sp. AH-716-O22]|nr:16S rRNA (cytidine(1402)-2'-O)-methyltransferase [Prochlorococcus sp. AH-716-O22]
MNTKTISSHKKKEPESGSLYIVGTPIGNLNDLSFRAVNILKNVSLIACEDTRQTSKIMSKFELKKNLISFNKHNSFNKIPKIIKDLKDMKSIALVSDAGMPGICDPGEDLIKEARSNEINIVCIPGPCAAITALVSSGFPSSKFTFEGFLPKKTSERGKILLEISRNEKTSIIFESPHRLIKLLYELKEYCGGDREIRVLRELTKKFEQHIGNNIYEVINFFNNREVIGEITVVINGTSKSKNNTASDDFEIKNDLYDLTNAGLSLSAASKYLAKKNKIPKSKIYNMY